MDHPQDGPVNPTLSLSFSFHPPQTSSTRSLSHPHPHPHPLPPPQSQSHSHSQSQSQSTPYNSPPLPYAPSSTPPVHDQGLLHHPLQPPTSTRFPTQQQPTQPIERSQLPPAAPMYKDGGHDSNTAWKSSQYHRTPSHPTHPSEASTSRMEIDARPRSPTGYAAESPQPLKSTGQDLNIYLRSRDQYPITLTDTITGPAREPQRSENTDPIGPWHLYPGHSPPKTAPTQSLQSHRPNCFSQDEAAGPSSMGQYGGVLPLSSYSPSSPPTSAIQDRSPKHSTEKRANPVSGQSPFVQNQNYPLQGAAGGLGYQQPYRSPQPLPHRPPSQALHQSQHQHRYQRPPYSPPLPVPHSQKSAGDLHSTPTFGSNGYRTTLTSEKEERHRANSCSSQTHRLNSNSPVPGNGVDDRIKSTFLIDRAHDPSSTAISYYATDHQQPYAEAGSSQQQQQQQTQLSSRVTTYLEHEQSQKQRPEDYGRPSGPWDSEPPRSSHSSKSQYLYPYEQERRQIYEQDVTPTQPLPLAKDQRGPLYSSSLSRSGIRQEQSWSDEYTSPSEALSHLPTSPPRSSHNPALHSSHRPSQTQQHSSHPTHPPTQGPRPDSTSTMVDSRQILSPSLRPRRRQGESENKGDTNTTHDSSYDSNNDDEEVDIGHIAEQRPSPLDRNSYDSSRKGVGGVKSRSKVQEEAREIDRDKEKENGEDEGEDRSKVKSNSLKFKFGMPMPTTVDLRSALETCDAICKFALHYGEMNGPNQSLRQDTGHYRGGLSPVLDPYERMNLQRIRSMNTTMLIGLQNTPRPNEKNQATGGDPTKRPSSPFTTEFRDPVHDNGEADDDRDQESIRSPITFGPGSPSSELVHELAKAATSIFQLAVRIKAWVGMTPEERELDDEINMIRGKRCLLMDNTLASMPSVDRHGNLHKEWAVVPASSATSKSFHERLRDMEQQRQSHNNLLQSGGSGISNDASAVGGIKQLHSSQPSPGFNPQHPPNVQKRQSYHDRDGTAISHSGPHSQHYPHESLNANSHGYPGPGSSKYGGGGSSSSSSSSGGGGGGNGSNVHLHPSVSIAGGSSAHLFNIGLNRNVVGGTSDNNTNGHDKNRDNGETSDEPSRQKYRKRAKRTQPPGRCLSCDSSDTPEWRRGPDGARTLCNACGLHYAKLLKRQNELQQQQMRQGGNAPVQGAGPGPGLGIAININRGRPSTLGSANRMEQLQAISFPLRRPHVSLAQTDSTNGATAGSEPNTTMYTTSGPSSNGSSSSIVDSSANSVNASTSRPLPSADVSSSGHSRSGDSGSALRGPVLVTESSGETTAPSSAVNGADVAMMDYRESFEGSESRRSSSAADGSIPSSQAMETLATLALSEHRS